MDRCTVWREQKRIRLERVLEAVNQLPPFVGEPVRERVRDLLVEVEMADSPDEKRCLAQVVTAAEDAVFGLVGESAR